MVPVVTGLMTNIQSHQQKTDQPQGKAEDVEAGVERIQANISKGYLNKMFEHAGAPANSLDEISNQGMDQLTAIPSIGLPDAHLIDLHLV